MTIFKTITALTAAASIAGCASQPDQIAASYVSPTAYQGMSCGSLNAEAQRVNARLVQTTGQQQEAANNDAAVTAVALVLFWPAAFFIAGKDSSAELARLKGEADGIQAAAIRAGCRA